MNPKYKNKGKVLVQKKWFLCSLNVQDVIVLKDPRNGNLIIKRINKIKKDLLYVLGDNNKESTDSRIFGWIKKSQIIGKVVY